ncbi:hypothetical protein C4M81_03070, partial [Mycoplasmopsis pullorum]|uniref:lipoprotein 17-related variable surface protein n=1 Tax=Mycoplasmopsis pullorum TaxID=48003 RepID=UPI001119ABAE
MNKKNIFKLLGATLSSTVFLIPFSGLFPIYMGKDTADNKYDSFFYEDSDIYSNSRYSPYGSWDGSVDYRFQGYIGTQNFVTVGDPSVTDNKNPNFLNTNYYSRFSQKANWVDPKSLDGRRRKWKLIYHKQQPSSFRDNRYLGGFYFSEDMILADNSFVKFSFYPADIDEIDYANVSTKEIPVSWSQLPTNKNNYTFINPLYSQNPYFEDKWENIVNWVNPQNTTTAGAAGYNNNSEIRLRGLWTNSAYPWTTEELAVAERNGLTRDNRSVIANRLINDPVTALGKGNPGFYHKSTKKINHFDNGNVAASLKRDGLYDEELLNNNGDGFWNLLNQNAGYMFTFFIDAPNARNRGWLNNVVVVEFETVDNPNFKWNGKNSVPTFLGGAYTLFDVGYNSGFEGESGFIIRSERAKSTQYKFRIKERVASSDSNFYLPKSFKRREDNEIDEKLYEVGVYYTNQGGTEIKLFDLDRIQYNKIKNATEYYSEYNLNLALNDIDPNTLKIKATIKDTNFRNQWEIAEARLSSTTKDPQGFYVFNDLVYTPLVTDRLKIEQMLESEFPNLSGWINDLVHKFIDNEFKDRGENKNSSDVWFDDHNLNSDRKYVDTYMTLLRRMIPTIQFASEVDQTYYSDTNKALSSDENKLSSQLNFAYSSTQNLKDMVEKVHEYLSTGKNALKNNESLPEGQKSATEWGIKLNQILGKDHQTYDQEVAKLDGYKVVNNTVSGNIYNVATSEFETKYSDLYQSLSQKEKDNLYKLFKDKAIEIINNQFTLTSTNNGIDNLIQTDSTQNLNKLREFQATVADAIQKRKYLNDYVTWIKNNLKTDAGEWKETVSENTLSTREGEEGQEEYNKFIDEFNNAEYQQIFLNDPTKEFLSNYEKFNNFKTKLENGLTTLTQTLQALDGNKNQAKKAVSSFAFVKDNEAERQEFDTLVKGLTSNYQANDGIVTNTNWTSNNEKLANQINTIFTKAKSNLTAKLNELTNLTQDERNQYIQLVNDAELNPISTEFSQFGNDANLKQIYDKAFLVDYIRSLTNLTTKQKQALIDQVNISDSNNSNYVNPENYETFKTNVTNLDTQMKALKDYYNKLPDSLKPNASGEITDELYVYEKTQSEKDNYKNYIEQTKAVIDDSSDAPITNSSQIQTLLRNLEDAKSKLDGSSSYLPRQNELKYMTVELKQQLLKEIDAMTDDSAKEDQFKKVQALDQAIHLELNKISDWQTNYVVDSNVGYKNAIDSLKTAADKLSPKLIAAYNLNLQDGNENKDKFGKVEQSDPNNYNELYTKALANFQALKGELSQLKTKLDESTRLYSLVINHTNNQPTLFATNVAKNYATDKSPFSVNINSNDPQATIENIQVIAANDVEGKLEITYEIVSNKANLTDVKTKVQTYIFKTDTNDNYQTEKQRLNTIANSINQDQSKINRSFTVANELANSETAKNKDNYSYPSATNEKLTFGITNINPEADYGRSTLNFTLTSTKTKEDLFWRSDNNLTDITYTAPKSDANSVMITGFKNSEKTRLDGLSGYTIDRINKSEILASKVTLNDLDGDKWNWNPETDGQYSFVDKRIVAYNDITGEIKLGFKLQSTKDNLQNIKSEEKFVTISGFKTELDRINELVTNTAPASVISQKSGTTNKKPSNLTSSDFVINVPNSLVNENVQIDSNLTLNPNDGAGEIKVAYTLISTRNDLVSNNWEPANTNLDPIKSKQSNNATFTGYSTSQNEDINRLNALAVSYENKNAQLMPSEISATNIDSALAVVLPQNSEAKVVDLTVTNQDDRSGNLTISYKLRSTKENLTDAETTVKTYTFKLETNDKYKTEQERIDALTYKPSLSENAKLNKTASEIEPSDIIFAISETDQAYQVRILPDSINDKTGAFTVEYKIKSKRANLDDIVSTEVRTATFNTLTESQRLDKVINDNTITKEITYAGQKAQNKVLASEVTKQMLSPNQTLLSDSKAKIEITNVKVDPNNNQQVIVTYNLTSTKDNLSDVTSSVTKEITIGGFQSLIDREKEIIDAYTNDEFVGLGDTNQLASAFNNASKYNEINLTFKTPDNHANERISITSVSGYNDVIGALKVKFKVISNKNGQDVASDTKEIIINNYLTEKGRLNNLREQMYNQNINVDYPQKSLLIPSKATANNNLSNFYYTQSTQNKAELINVSKVSVDDDAAIANIAAELRSTKTQDQLISNWGVDT